MEEFGVVVKTDKNFAVVKVDKKAECLKCGMCAFPKNVGFIEFYSDNSIGAKVGDKVQVSTSENGNLLGALLVFFVPLILIAVAAVVALTLIKREIFVLVLSVIFVAIWFAVLGIIDKKLKRAKSFSSKILRVIEEEKEMENGNKEYIE
ncbi:MAG: SoxR reducing system RseC family protein [Clostridia bacterium]|nr:SoxR reducing system RseC family protein [Clostridia bacterium]